MPINHYGLRINRKKEFMNFEVNGIAFSKDELTAVKLSDLKLDAISHSHLFFIPASNRKAFLILRAGDYIDREFIDKYKAKGIESIYALEVASIDDIQKLRSLFLEWKNGYNEKNKQIGAQRIIKEFGNDFWRLSKSSYLSFVLVCFENLYKLPNEVVETYQATSLTMYSRATISASLSVITCFVHRIVDPLFVQDLYNVVFALDYGLVTTGEFTYSLAQACEAERNNPGSGIEYLNKMGRPAGEITAFTQHPVSSAMYVEDQKEIFTYPEVSSVICYHHEKVDGSGFPSGVSYSGIGDLETFQMFCDYVVPFQEHIYQRGDGYVLIKGNFEALKNNENIGSLPINKIINIWEAAMAWAIKKEVSTKESTKEQVA